MTKIKFGKYIFKKRVKSPIFVRYILITSIGAAIGIMSYNVKSSDPNVDTPIFEVRHSFVSQEFRFFLLLNPTV
jgi:hypothetical protein